MSKSIGLISGSGKFPFFFAKAAKERGFYVSAIAIKGNTNPQLKRFVDSIRWFGIDEFKKILLFLKDEDINDVVMAGKINPSVLYQKNITRDAELKKMFLEIKDRRADSIFKAIADILTASGLRLLDSTIFLKDFLAKKEFLTKDKPTEAMWEDIRFGFQIAKKIAGLDVGQTIVVKQKTIVAVEAMEGTDSTIIRAGKIANNGCVVVKVSKPNQDMRFDIPVVGLNTIRNLVKIRAACLAIEAEKTLLFDKDKCVNLAEKNGVVILAI